MPKKLYITTVLVALLWGATFAHVPHAVVFYNVENLFDTVDCPATKDREFTPKGRYRWSGEKYLHKLRNVGQVIAGIAVEAGQFPAVVGFAEVETRGVLEDLASSELLVDAKYEVIHYDSPDERGIDVAMLYRADLFALVGSSALRAEGDFPTRDLLTAWGTVEGEEFFFIVVHCPSRRGGVAESSPRREAICSQMRHVIDSVCCTSPNMKFVVMGDFNDDPNDLSLRACLGAKCSLEELGRGDLFNPYYNMYNVGYGTSAYRGRWNLFDNIIVSRNLVAPADGSLGLCRKGGYYGNIFKPRYLIQSEGHFRGYPYRTFAYGKFIGGYSDHLPVYILVD